jgi:imidazolonepropionase-like amidohydrolase
MRRALLFIAIAASLRAESGTFTIHMILHAIGEERWEIAQKDDGFVLTATTEQSDRGNKRTSTATLRMDSRYTPQSFERGPASTAPASSSNNEPLDYTGMHSTSFAVQTAMLRHWIANGKPKSLASHGAASDQPIRIEAAGHDVISIGGRKTSLDRFTVANLMFGREIVWMDTQQNLAAAMTFAGGLPIEAIRTEYLSALDSLYRAGVAQEMADQKALQRAVPAEASGAIAILGAKMVSALTGTLPVEDTSVIVRDGRITAIGPRSTTDIPRGAKVIEAKGKTILPGLWEMHTHFSGVEFGPALLAAGITTARDCGGEFDYLVAQRDAIEYGGAIAPRLLLAGLVDAGGAKAFGHVTAETRDEGREVVHRYSAAGFQQIKLYTFLAPDVVDAIAAEAHRYHMTVTGHVPQAMNAFEGVAAGMDQINHLNYVSNMMRAPAERGGRGAGPVDIYSEAAQKAIRFFKDHKTVIDPTAGWGEMANHSKDVDVATFEPGILKSPFVLDAKYRGMGGNTTAEQMHARMAQTLAVIGALHRAGVAIVPGSDTGLVGYGLHRELELYVEAGMTPFEAIQAATIVSARAMKLDKEVGTIEVGKRADLILVDGDPFHNIADLRKVSRVIANGRMYDPAKLWQTVGFRP